MVLRFKTIFIFLGVLFCVGGRGASGDPFKSIEVYDPRRNRWFQVSEMNTRRRHVGVCCSGGKYYSRNFQRIVILKRLQSFTGLRAVVLDKAKFSGTVIRSALFSKFMAKSQNREMPICCNFCILWFISFLFVI